MTYFHTLYLAEKKKRERAERVLSGAKDRLATLRSRNQDLSEALSREEDTVAYLRARLTDTEYRLEEAQADNAALVRQLDSNKGGLFGWLFRPDRTQRRWEELMEGAVPALNSAGQLSLTDSGRLSTTKEQE